MAQNWVVLTRLEDAELPVAISYPHLKPRVGRTIRRSGSLLPYVQEGSQQKSAAEPVVLKLWPPGHGSSIT